MNSWFLRRTLPVVMVASLMFGCAKKAHQVDDKLNDPPSDASAAKVPDGPPVVHSGGASTVAEPPVEEGGATVTRAEVESFRNRGPAYVLTLVTVEPVHGASGFVGYQIAATTRTALDFMSPQLEVGDVVTHINGVRQQRPDDLLQAWRSLENVQSIRVDYNRGGEALHAVWSVQ